MHIFLDSANLEHIQSAAKLGVVSGATTNPTLVTRGGKGTYKEIVLSILDLLPGEVSVEVLSQERDLMLEEARNYSSWSPRIVIKIPPTWEGISAISILSHEGIKTNLTLCFSLNQALLGAVAGANYVSPFVGRMDDVGEDGMKLVVDIVEAFSHYSIKTQVIAASIRHPLHCVQALKAGAHIATIPYEVLLKMVDHPLTTIGISRFMEDARRIK
jgi:transaldolase